MNSVLSSILLVSILLTTSFFVQVSSKSCNHYSDCASREICDSGNCRNLKILILYECVDIYHCIDGKRCIFGECRTPTLGGLCMNNLDCPAACTCKSGICHDSALPWWIYLVIVISVAFPVIIIIGLLLFFCGGRYWCPMHPMLADLWIVNQPHLILIHLRHIQLIGLLALANYYQIQRDQVISY